MKAIRTLAWSLAVLIPLSVTPKALAANVFPGVGTVDYNQAGNTLTLIIPYGGRNPYRVQWLNGQSRLVVDVEGMWLPSNRAMYIGMGVVEQVRASRLRSGVTRLIFDLSQSADLRTLTDQGTRTLTLTVFPRGGTPIARYAPPYAYAPGPRPTRRPAPPLRPVYPTYPSYPTARITPAPVPQPSFAPIAVPTPFSTPVPTPEPTFVPTPMPTSEATPTPEVTPEAGAQEFAVFGSRFTVGAEVPLTLTESYAAGGSDASVGLVPGGAIDWNQMFGSYFGLGLGTHAFAYTLNDTEASNSNVQIHHNRKDYELNVGPRFRLPLGGGMELYAQPGFLGRMVQVDSSSDTLGADGTPSGNPTALTTASYLNSGWTGYGAQLQAGFGYHVFGPLSLALTGEFNDLLAGSMSQPGVATIFPLMGFRAGLEGRLDFGLFDTTIGYNYTSNFNGGIGLSQSYTGPYLKVGVVY